jgi:uncharacterized membrane protein YbhN (UPF0104 family)
VLSWRLLNFWLPIPFGGGAYLSLRLRTRQREPDPTIPPGLVN